MELRVKIKASHPIYLALVSGQSLNDAGESFKRLAEVKYSLEENVKQNFLEPLSHLQTKDLKEVNVSWRFPLLRDQ